MSVPDLSQSYYPGADVGVDPAVIERNDGVYDDAHMPPPPKSGDGTVDYFTSLLAYGGNLYARTRRPDGSVGGPTYGQRDAATQHPAVTVNSEGGARKTGDERASYSGSWTRCLLFAAIAAVLVFLLWKSLLAAIAVGVAVFLLTKAMGWGG